jgi:hypothetical protein
MIGCAAQFPTAERQPHRGFLSLARGQPARAIGLDDENGGIGNLAQ